MLRCVDLLFLFPIVLAMRINLCCSQGTSNVNIIYIYMSNKMHSDSICTICTNNYPYNFNVLKINLEFLKLHKQF